MKLRFGVWEEVVGRQKTIAKISEWKCKATQELGRGKGARGSRQVTTLNKMVGEVHNDWPLVMQAGCQISEQMGPVLV